jgi:hypothetical protein
MSLPTEESVAFCAGTSLSVSNKPISLKDTLDISDIIGRTLTINLRNNPNVKDRERHHFDVKSQLRRTSVISTNRGEIEKSIKEAGKEEMNSRNWSSISIHDSTGFI